MVVTVVAMLTVLAALTCLDISRGDFAIPIGQVLDVLTGGGTRPQRVIVLDVRLPRALTAILVGLALGLAGALTQSVLRNPLASPDILGITAGASVGAVALILAGSTAVAGNALALPAAALAGGLLTALAMYLLAWRGGVDGFRLVLIGIGVNALMVAVLSWLLVSARIADVARAQIWLNGSLNETGWSRLGPIAAAFGVVAAIALTSVLSLRVLRLGDDTARALGVRLQAQQAVLLLAGVTAAALATAAAGPIGFVALAAPQIARMLLRTDGEPLIGSALLGAVLVVGADVLARTLLPVALPVGVVTSALGGPFLLYLLVRTNRKADAV
ncbi:MAG TPA: iron chelate uptake ABC transporter family permease subunit [Aldersonia sp.]